jgi:signal transduction histidine kinase
LNLGEVVQELIASLKETAQEAGSELNYECFADVEVRWDKLRITQAITNLVANAIKYGAGKPIKVSVAEVNGRVSIVVKDHGMGIAPKDQSRIFKRFERIGSPHNVSGLGLGLYIAQQIAEAHGGSITLDSEVGVGSTFTLEIPAT